MSTPQRLLLLLALVAGLQWNPVDESEYKRPGSGRVAAFKEALELVQGPSVTVRTTRGLEAAAACGQLRNQHQKVPLTAALPL